MNSFTLNLFLLDLATAIRHKMNKKRLDVRIFLSTYRSYLQVLYNKISPTPFDTPGQLFPSFTPVQILGNNGAIARATSVVK